MITHGPGVGKYGEVAVDLGLEIAFSNKLTPGSSAGHSTDYLIQSTPISPAFIFFPNIFQLCLP